MSVKPATSVFSPGSRVFIIALVFNITPQPVPGDPSPQQQRNLASACSVRQAALAGYSASSSALLFQVVITKKKKILSCGGSVLFCQALVLPPSPSKHVNSVSLAVNKWPWARCTRRTLSIMGKRGGRLLAPCGVRRAERRPPPSAQVKQARWNKEKKSGQRKQGGRGAEWKGGEEESVSSLKERNGRIGAFPPRGYSTFMTKRRDEGRRGEERRSTFILRACICARPSRWHPLHVGALQLEAPVEAKKIILTLPLVLKVRSDTWLILLQAGENWGTVK